mgnify:CR=1 FL=1
MTTRAFSPKLKIFSNNCFLFQLLLLLLVVTIGCSDSGPVRPRQGLGELPVKEQQLRQAPRAPWEMWSAETYGSPELALAERLAAAGRLREAGGA